MAANKTRMPAAPMAGMSQIVRQSCGNAPPVTIYASTTAPDTNAPMNNPAPSVTNAMKPCAAARTTPPHADAGHVERIARRAMAWSAQHVARTDRERHAGSSYVADEVSSRYFIWHVGVSSNVPLDNTTRVAGSMVLS